jgi:tetratricopeptide (TPR) repeat protein
MKKSLIVLLLAVGSLAAQAQDAPAAQQQPAPDAAPAAQQQPAPGTAAPAAQQKKVIQDPNEYNAYVAAVNTTDPAKKAQMMESYIQTYPNSVMKEDGLEILLKTYQQLNKADQIKVVAQRLLQVDPNNLTALALLSYLDRAAAQAGGADAATELQEAGKLGTHGLELLKTATKPEGYTDDQWNTMKSSFRVIYLGSVGHAALQAKDYAAAQENLKEVVALQPTDVNSIYLLALAYLSPKPPVVDGLFWIAKAAASAPQLMPYGKNQYDRYHGSDEGFDALVASAKAAPTIPAGFTVTPAPSPADQAAEMLKKGPPETLSFAEWQFILTNGNKDASDQVWSAIKGKPVQLVAVVVDSSRDSLKLAGSVDDIDAKKADITLNLKEPLAAARVPQAGTELTVQGVPSEFNTPADSFNMVFADGEVLKGLPEAAKKPAAGVHHKPVQ